MIILTEDLRSIDLTGKGFGVTLNEIKFYEGLGHHEKPLHFESNKKALAMMSIIVTAQQRGDDILDLKLVDGI